MKQLLELSGAFLALEHSIKELKTVVGPANATKCHDALWGYLPQDVYAGLEYVVQECNQATNKLRGIITEMNCEDAQIQLLGGKVEVWHMPAQGFGEHEHVATLNVGGNGKDKENLAKAFTATQNGDGDWGENPEVVKLHLPEPRSTSVGDLLVSNGRVWEVQKRGFKDLALNHNPLLEKK